MLTDMRVRDLAVIADVSLHLEPGLNVLTGETGAGKSMLVDALALLLGERASGDLVRPGADRAVVEAGFDVTGPGADEIARHCRDAGIDLDEGRLVVRREIRVSGPNRAWANGSPTTVGVLAELGRLLVDLHGQHEAQSLLRPVAQRAILDAFAGAEAERSAAASAYATAREVGAALGTLVERHSEVQRRADYLRHVVQEVTAAAPKPGEDETLAVEARRLGAGEDVQRLAEQIAGALDDEEQGAVERLREAGRALAQLERLDPSADAWRELLDGAFAQADEAARAVRDYLDGLDLDPARLEEVERRRDVLFRLLQKYGPALDDVRRTADEARAELDLLDTAAFDLAALEERKRDADATLTQATAALSAKRKKAAGRLAREVGKLLPDLGMPTGVVTVEVQAGPVGPDGADQVTFLVQLNPGLEARPLADVASGGELSRLMLALKVVLAAHDRVPTLVFDEVDQGVGGDVGQHVADALVRVADTRQVLVVTHLAAIAARADHHLRVRKQVARGVTAVEVEALGGEVREQEVARMLGDAGDRALRTHAADLLRKRAGAAPRVAR
ncbi:MAG: DNA repair protein RecN [Gemmatimonadota bacterium]|nr:DNA repair protein RecN [Gemmatimonadota bacterium]MDH5198716.1 DNA repair protein RecN [Gemmatimonadota bacterium]